MRKTKKLTLSLIFLLVINFTMVAFAGCGDSGKIKLFFDSGGGSGNYTTTSSYHTLEDLANEWNKNNETYQIVINKASLNGNRGAITSMLSAGTAPDMLMQTGNVVNDDIGNGWYADLTEYLNEPNPYEKNNSAWKDIYPKGSIEARKASDGKNYYVCLDQVAIGMLYNMDILNLAGVTEVPTTYTEFLNCLKALENAKKSGKISQDVEIYMHGGLWNESYIGTSVYGEMIKGWDLDNSGTVSTYELIKSYKDNKWSLHDERFREFLKLCYDKAKYYPENYLAYDTAYSFAKGRLAITDALGNSMRTLTKNARFNVKIAGYPVLDNEASKFGGNKVIRGSAGLSTAYWVTNSAVNKGQEAVDACVDFLRFLTAKDNNARFVNDLGYALPINVDSSNVEFFTGLRELYNNDLKEEDAIQFAACYIPELLGTEFNDYYQLAMGDFYEDSEGNKTGDIDAVISTLDKKIDGCIDTIIRRYNWVF